LEFQLESLLLGTVLGALLGGVVNAAVSRYGEFKLAHGLASALRAEVRTLVGLLIFRGYGSEVQKIIARLTDASHQLNDDDVFGARITLSYFVVFAGAGSKLGLLDELAEDTVATYYLAQSLIEDIRQFWFHRERLLEGKWSLEEHHREWLLQMTFKLSELLNLCVLRGQMLDGKLELFSKRRWLGILP
jgi:hypothetical protein